MNKEPTFRTDFVFGQRVSLFRHLRRGLDDEVVQDDLDGDAESESPGETKPELHSTTLPPDDPSETELYDEESPSALSVAWASLCCWGAI